MAIALLSVLVVYAPAVVGRLVTSTQHQPRGMLTHPHDGWRLLVDVLRRAPAAELPTPGRALERARQTWDASSGFRPQRAVLVSASRSDALELELVDQTQRACLMPSSLAWVIEGRKRSSRGSGVLGMLDYDTAQVSCNARTGAADQEKQQP